MKLQLNRPLVVFDLETTGVNVNVDRIVELAAIKLQPTGKTEELVLRINPGIHIPSGVSQVHGIYDQDVRLSPTFAKVAHEVERFFEGCDVAGYNCISFDVPLLTAELRRVGRALDLLDVVVLDAYRIFKANVKHTLGDALRHYCGTKHEKAHNAKADVEATLDVLLAQLDAHDLPNEPQAIAKALHDPNEVDKSGKLRRSNGQIVIAFGKHSGKTLDRLAAEAPGYIEWMLNKDIVPDARALLRDALARARR